MPSGKVPGAQGIPPEFYRYFWTEIGGLVIETVKQAAQQGFSKSERRGIITLMEKPKKDLLDIASWRPLSLLSTCYKIFSKILARRLEKVLPKIIHKDQSGFIKKRGLNENLINLAMLMQISQSKNIPAIFTSFDFRKAFDLVQWDILFKTMSYLNFGEGFINYIRNLYKDIESCTTNCGYTNQYFSITRGLRQGCPLSSGLFTILVEVLGNKLRNSSHISGIMDDNSDHKKFTLNTQMISGLLFTASRIISITPYKWLKNSLETQG